MTEMDFRPTDTTIGAVRRTVSGGGERCYVRFAVLGDRGGRWPSAAGTGGWPRLLADLVGESHDVSWWDASVAGASTYDVRRVQLRAVAAHRPHLVALDAGRAELGRRDWDVSEVRAHLTHCAQALTRRGAVLLTTTPARRSRWHRCRAEQLDGVYVELARRFGTVHLDRSASAAATAERFAEALSARGLELAR